MTHKRIYETPSDINDIYVEVLCRCTVCGLEDAVTDSYEIEHIHDSFQDTENISEYPPCPVCGEHSYDKKREIIQLAFPTQLTQEYPNYNITSLLNGIKDFEQKLQFIKANDFRVYTILPDQQQCIFYKDL